MTRLLRLNSDSTKKKTSTKTSRPNQSPIEIPKARANATLKV